MPRELLFLWWGFASERNDWDCRFFGRVMPVILTFASKWVRWYGVLRYAKEISFVDSLRYALWLARS